MAGSSLVVGALRLCLAESDHTDCCTVLDSMNSTGSSLETGSRSGETLHASGCGLCADQNFQEVSGGVCQATQAA